MMKSQDFFTCIYFLLRIDELQAMGSTYYIVYPNDMHWTAFPAMLRLCSSFHNAEMSKLLMDYV